MKVWTALFIFTFVVILSSCKTTQENKRTNPIESDRELGVFYAGPLGGFNKALHTVDLASFAEDPLCPFFSNGDDNGFYLGLGAEFPFKQTNNQHSISVKLIYNSMPSFFKVEEDKTYPSFLVGLDGKPLPETVNTSTRNTLQVKYNLITLEAIYSFQPEPSVPVRIAIGPTFDFAMTKTFTQNLELLSDNPDVSFIPKQEYIDKGYKYINNNRTIVVKDGDVPDSSPLRIGIKLGVEFPFNMNKILIIPSAFYNFGVTKLTSSEDWRVNAFQIGVDIRLLYCFNCFLGII